MGSVDDGVAMLTRRDSGQPWHDSSFGTKAPGAHGITQSLPNPSIVIREPTVQTFDDSNSACAVRTGAYTIAVGVAPFTQSVKGRGQW